MKPSIVLNRMHATYGLHRIFKRQKRHIQRKQKTLFVLPLITMAIFGVAGSQKHDLRRGRKVTPRTTFNITEHIAAIGQDHFKSLYRISWPQLQTLVCLTKPYLQPFIQRCSAYAAVVSAEVKLLITLRVLAGASYLDVGWPYGVGRSTTYAVFRQSLYALNKALPVLSFPQTEKECHLSSLLFQRNRKSPIQGIIAALNGIAIEIMKPRAGSTPDARKYFNRKGFYSLCVQAAVGADYKFYFVSARHAGGTHDSTALQATKLFDLLQSTRLPEWATVAADDAYSNGRHILTPYSGSGLSVMKDSFNFYLSSCRITVEQAFGILVSRFGIFWSALRYDLTIDTLIIMVACKLHNFIMDTTDDQDFRTIPIADENFVAGSPTVHIQNLLHTEQDVLRSRQRRRQESALRDKIAEKLHSLGLVRARARL